MRKITVIAIIAFLMTGCFSTKFHSLTTNSTSFKPYADKGFTVSTTIINKPFKPLGMVEVLCLEGYDISKKENQVERGDNIYYKAYKDNMIVLCRTTDLLDALYNEAINLGANGIINFEIISVPVETTKEIRTGLKASALAVKIE